jgi:hypothetical protein
MTCLQLCQNKILRIPKIIPAKGMELYWGEIGKSKIVVGQLVWLCGICTALLHGSAETGNRQPGKWRNCTWKPYETVAFTCC